MPKGGDVGIIQHLPSDVVVVHAATPLQLFLENYCDSLIEKIYLPLFG